MLQGLGPKFARVSFYEDEKLVTKNVPIGSLFPPLEGFATISVGQSVNAVRERNGMKFFELAVVSDMTDLTESGKVRVLILNRNLLDEVELSRLESPNTLILPGGLRDLKEGRRFFVHLKNDNTIVDGSFLRFENNGKAIVILETKGRRAPAERKLRLLDLDEKSMHIYASDSAVADPSLQKGSRISELAVGMMVSVPIGGSGYKTVSVTKIDGDRIRTIDSVRFGRALDPVIKFEWHKRQELQPALFLRQKFSVGSSVRFIGANNPDFTFAKIRSMDTENGIATVDVWLTASRDSHQSFAPDYSQEVLIEHLIKN
jgi:hypothetical protein